MKKLLLLSLFFSGFMLNAQEFFLKDSIKGIWGLKDVNGKIIPSVAYYCQGEYPVFSEGLAMMYKFIPDDRIDSLAVWGYINVSGDVSIPFKYNHAENFNDGVAFANIVITEKDGTFIENKNIILDKTGKEHPLSEEYRNIQLFHEGIAIVSNDLRFCHGKWGFIDSLGREITPLKYDQVWEFSEGLAAVNIGAIGCEGGKWGFIDKKGKVVIPIKYDYVGMIDGGYDLFGFQFGKAIVGLGKESFYIDKKGVLSKIPTRKEENNQLTDEKHKEYPIRNFSSGWYGFEDEKGNRIATGFDMAYPFWDGVKIVQVKKNGKWAYLNARGDLITEFKYDDSEEFKDGCAIVSTGKNGNYAFGLIDSTGKEILALGSYDFMYDFKNGMAAVRKNKKYGYIDTKGKEIIPCIYDRTDGFNSKVAFTVLNKKEGFIDQRGKEVIPFGKYDNLKETNNGFFRFSRLGKEGLIDAEGKEIVPAKKYQSIATEFYEGLAMVYDQNHKIGFINEEGKEIIPCIYDRADDFYYGEKAKVKLYNRYFYIDKNGKEIVE